MSQQIILAIAEIFGLFFIGALARRMKYIRETEIDRWTRLVLDFLMPLFTFTTIVTGVDKSRIGELWILPVIGLGQVLVFTALGLLLQYGLPSKDADKRRTFLHFCAFNNYGYLPVIIFTNLWGAGSLGTLFIIGIGCGIGVWTVGVAVLGATDIKSAAKNIVTPNLLAIFAALGVGLTCGSAVIPELAMRILTRAGSIAVPLILVLVGASLAKRGTLRMSWPVAYITIVRLIILPLCTIPLLRLLPVSHDFYAASVIIALMPVAVNTVVMTRRYGGKPDYAASSALVTTVVSVVTVPVAVWLFL
jgi:hypothetical protein